MRYVKPGVMVAAALCILLLSLCGCAADPTPSPDESSRPETSSSTGTGGGGSTATGDEGQSDTGSTASGTVPTAPTPVEQKDFGGREFRYGCSWAPWWSADPEGVEVRETFEKQYNCKLTYVPLTSDDDYSTLMTSIMSGNPTVDYFNSTGNRTLYWIQKGLIAPLSQYQDIHLEDTSVWVSSITDYYTVDGKAYGSWPASAATVREVLMYNKSLINGEDDLYTLQKEGKLTWDKLYEIARKVSTGGVYGITSMQSQTELLDTLVLSNGGSVYSRQGDSLNFTYTYDSDATRYAMSTLQKWSSANLILPTIGSNYTYPQQQFAKGRVAMMVADNWNISYAYEKAKFKIGIVLFPAGPNNTSTPYYVNQSCAFADFVCATAKNPADVVFVMNYFGTQQVATQDSWEITYGDLLGDDEALESLRTYQKLISEGKYTVDYKSLLDSGDIYSNNLWSNENALMMREMTPQQFLETVGPLYRKIEGELR